MPKKSQKKSLLLPQRNGRRTLGRIPVRIWGAAAFAFAFVVIGTYVVLTTRASSVGITAPAQTLSNLAYSTVSASQKLDLYLPARTGAAIPVVVKIHGGAWYTGDKTDDMAYMVGPALAQGWAVASINYRLAGEAKFPASVQDVRQAVRWLKDNAATYGLDTSRFASWGESSGGYFAEELGVTGDQNSSVLDSATLGEITTSPAVQAAVSFYGVSDIGTIDSQAPAGCGTNSNSPTSVDSVWLGAPVQTSPNLAASILENYVPTAKTLPPLYMAHGTADCDVPYGQSVEMKAAYDKAGGASELHPFTGLGHADQRILDGSVTPAIAFVANTFGTPLATPVVTPVPSTTPAPTAKIDEKVTTGTNHFTYTGTWTDCGGCNAGAYQNSFKYAYTTGASFTLSFSGTQASIGAYREPAGGIASVSIDGGAAFDVDYYSANQTLQTIYTTPVLANGAHTLKFTVSGRKSSGSSATINVDSASVYTGGVASPTPMPTATPVPTPVPTPAPTPVPTATPVPTPTPIGSAGLTGKYYSGKGFAGTLLATRIDPTVNFNWITGTPMSGVPADNFSVRWTGSLKASTTGSYTIGFNGDDGYRVYVNGTLVVNAWVDQGATYKTGKINLNAGSTNSIVVEYYEHTGNAVAQLYWTVPGGSKQIIPSANLLSQ